MHGWQMSHEEALELTLPQLANLRHEGKPPRPGARTFATREAMDEDRKRHTRRS